MEATNEKTGYKVWAVDDVVYGPVELPVLVGWIKEQRVLASTWIYSEQHDCWHKAATVPELQIFFKSTAAAPAVPIGGPPHEHERHPGVPHC